VARFNRGWIKLYYSLLESDIAQRGTFTLGVFVRLLIMANWKEGRGLVGRQKLILQPGQLVTGLRELSPNHEEDPYLHRVRGALRYLESSGAIAQATSNHGRVITIINWQAYQGGDDESASKPQATRKQSASTAQHSKDSKKEEIDTSPKGRKTYPLEFEEIYRTYPRLEGKAPGFRIYQRAIKTPEDRADLARAVAHYARAKAGTDPQYLMHFGTFMGQWEDWLDPATGTSQAKPSINLTPIKFEDTA
jgi:hypothetical protein